MPGARGKDGNVLFGRRKNAGRPPSGNPNPLASEEAPLYHIEFDMMQKGFLYKRRSGMVRQFGVTVRGATRLVTSGDWVDRETFEALVRAGAIRPPVSEKSPEKASGEPPTPDGPPATSGKDLSPGKKRPPKRAV